MRTTLDFSPLFRTGIGFDRVFDALDTATRVQPVDNWPPYDIIKQGEDSYRIVMAVAGFERDCVERHVPGTRRILDESDFVRSAIDQSCGSVVDVLHRLQLSVLRFITTNARFKSQVIDNRIHDRLRHQRRPRVIKMHHILAPWRLPARTINIKAHLIHG